MIVRIESVKSMKLIDADKLCEDLLNRWSIADTRKEELIRQIMADIVTPVVVSQPTINHWIPCGEKLPKKEELHYWVCTDTGYQCQCRWTNDVYGFGASDRWDWKIFDIPQYQKVIAWMPLPEPYREEGDE